MTRAPRAGGPQPPPEERESITLRTPAKINLNLRVVGRRADGYHLLDSLFAPIDLWDEVEVRRVPGRDGIDFELLVDGRSERGVLPTALADVATGPDNLAVRAAERFREATGLPGRFLVRLRKRIPVGAGLGGGSSDAAATLRALACLAGRRAPDRGRLEALALELGADVPFFLAPIPARVTGIGERIEPVPGLPVLALVLANPGISVSTAQVYRASDALSARPPAPRATTGDSLTPPGAGSTMRPASGLRGSESGVGDFLLQNDLMPAAIRLCPPIGRLLEEFRRLERPAKTRTEIETEEGKEDRPPSPLGVSMSGSGASVFALFASSRDAVRAANAIELPAGAWVQVTKTLRGPI